MSQIWPLFLKKTGLKEADFKTVSGDAQTKLNAVMNGQADLLLGYVMDQAIKLQDATKKPVYPIRFADYGVNMISSGIIVNSETLEIETRHGQALPARDDASALEESEKNPEAAVDAMLKANAKAGVRDTLIIGLKQTTALYHTKETAKQRPLRVSMADVERVAGPACAIWRTRPRDQGQGRRTGSCSTFFPDRRWPFRACPRRRAIRRARR